MIENTDGRLINQGTVISGEHALTLRAHGIDNAGTVSYAFGKMLGPCVLVP